MMVSKKSGYSLEKSLFTTGSYIQYISDKGRQRGSNIFTWVAAEYTSKLSSFSHTEGSIGFFVQVNEIPPGSSKAGKKRYKIIGHPPVNKATNEGELIANMSDSTTPKVMRFDPMVHRAIIRYKDRMGIKNGELFFVPMGSGNLLKDTNYHLGTIYIGRDSNAARNIRDYELFQQFVYKFSLFQTRINEIIERNTELDAQGQPTHPVIKPRKKILRQFRLFLTHLDKVNQYLQGESRYYSKYTQYLAFTNKEEKKAELRNVLLATFPLTLYTHGQNTRAQFAEFQTKVMYDLSATEINQIFAGFLEPSTINRSFETITALMRSSDWVKSEPLKENKVFQKSIGNWTKLLLKIRPPPD
jgi:hypothetical protein